MKKKSIFCIVAFFLVLNFLVIGNTLARDAAVSEESLLEGWYPVVYYTDWFNGCISAGVDCDRVVFV